MSFGLTVEATFMAMSFGFGVMLRFPRQMATAQELLITVAQKTVPIFGHFV